MIWLVSELHKDTCVVHVANESWNKTELNSWVTHSFEGVMHRCTRVRLPPKNNNNPNSLGMLLDDDEECTEQILEWLTRRRGRRRSVSMRNVHVWKEKFNRSAYEEEGVLPRRLTMQGNLMVDPSFTNMLWPVVLNVGMVWMTRSSPESSAAWAATSS